MATLIGLACAQCGSPVGDFRTLPAWLHGRLALAGEFEPAVVDHLLLCPDCLDEEHGLNFEQGEGD